MLPGYTRCMSSSDEILAALRRYWGYDSFLPLQERIVASLLGGHDTCVVMPAGGSAGIRCPLFSATLLLRLRFTGKLLEVLTFATYSP